MEYSKFLLASFLLLSSWPWLGFSQGEAGPKDLMDNMAKGGGLLGAGAGDGDAMKCIQKLLPCKNYLVSPEPPPTSCCVPLKGMIEKDVECLCKVFNNPGLLKSLNTTQDNALKLPKACGAEADISKCKNASASPSGSPPKPSTPATPPSGSGKSAGDRITQFPGLGGFISCFVALIASAF